MSACSSSGAQTESARVLPTDWKAHSVCHSYLLTTIVYANTVSSRRYYSAFVLCTPIQEGPSSESSHRDRRGCRSVLWKHPLRDSQLSLLNSSMVCLYRYSARRDKAGVVRNSAIVSKLAAGHNYAYKVWISCLYNNPLGNVHQGLRLHECYRIGAYCHVFKHAGTMPFSAP